MFFGDIPVEELNRPAQVELFKETSEDRWAWIAAEYGFGVNKNENVELTQDWKGKLLNPVAFGRINLLGEFSSVAENSKISFGGGWGSLVRPLDELYLTFDASLLIGSNSAGQITLGGQGKFTLASLLNSGETRVEVGARYMVGVADSSTEKPYLLEPTAGQTLDVVLKINSELGIVSAKLYGEANNLVTSGGDCEFNGGFLEATLLGNTGPVIGMIRNLFGGVEVSKHSLEPVGIRGVIGMSVGSAGLYLKIGEGLATVGISSESSF